MLSGVLTRQRAEGLIAEPQGVPTAEALQDAEDMAEYAQEGTDYNCSVVRETNERDTNARDAADALGARCTNEAEYRELAAQHAEELEQQREAVIITSRVRPHRHLHHASRRHASCAARRVPAAPPAPRRARPGATAAAARRPLRPAAGGLRPFLERKNRRYLPPSYCVLRL